MLDTRDRIMVYPSTVATTLISKSFMTCVKFKKKKNLYLVNFILFAKWNTVIRRVKRKTYPKHLKIKTS